jgi:putative transposase
MMNIYRPHKNTPPHWFVSNTLYMVTGSILYGKPLLDSDEKLSNFCKTLFERAKILNWEVEAWFVMSTHYHFIARSPENALSLKELIQGIHSINAKFVNRMDGTPGRKVWYNYWDSCIQTEDSYFARMRYVMINQVKHGLVQNAEEYLFSSYKYFIENTEAEFRSRVLASSDAVKVEGVD